MSALTLVSVSCSSDWLLDTISQQSSYSELCLVSSVALVPFLSVERSRICITASRELSQLRVSHGSQFSVQ